MLLKNANWPQRHLPTYDVGVKREPKIKKCYLIFWHENSIHKTKINSEQGGSDE